METELEMNRRPTSLRLDADLLRRAAHYAIDHDTTVQEMIERGLRNVLGEQPVTPPGQLPRGTPRKYYVVINGVVQGRVKEWLRQHPDVLPGIDPGDKITHDLARRLKRLGWSEVVNTDSVYLSPPVTVLQA